MESTAFPPVLVSLIDSINSESYLHSWRLNSTSECYFLVVEWTRLIPRKDDADSQNSQVSFPQELSLTIETENSTQKPAAFSADSCKGELQKCEGSILEKALEMKDFIAIKIPLCSLETNETCKEDAACEEEEKEPEITKATMMENKWTDYETQVSVKSTSKPLVNYTSDHERNVHRATFKLSPPKGSGPTTNAANERTRDNAITETPSAWVSKEVNRGKKAICSCGRTFNARHLAVRHLLFHCPVSLCFRIELECKIQREIGSWPRDQKMVGNAWWESFKKKGFPDILIELKEDRVNKLSVLVNDFIERASSQKLKDQNGKDFLLVAGLEDLLH